MTELMKGSKRHTQSILLPSGSHQKLASVRREQVRAVVHTHPPDLHSSVDIVDGQRVGGSGFASGPGLGNREQVGRG